MSADHLRKHIIFVPQDPTLFNRSIKENIAYGEPEMSLEEITLAAKMAYAHDFINNIPEKYDYIVGERGCNLSGGQRQRILLARAFMRPNASIVLLDEATAALDAISERHLQKTLGLLMQEKTAIMITHKLSSTRMLDRILVFKDGQIIEDGKHEDLLEMQGVYANLWHLQSESVFPN